MLKQPESLVSAPIMCPKSRSKLNWMSVPTELVNNALRLVNKTSNDIESKSVLGSFTTIRFK